MRSESTKVPHEFDVVVTTGDEVPTDRKLATTDRADVELNDLPRLYAGSRH